jgi:hypothetical protein
LGRPTPQLFAGLSRVGVYQSIFFPLSRTRCHTRRGQPVMSQLFVMSNLDWISQIDQFAAGRALHELRGRSPVANGRRDNPRAAALASWFHAS